MFYAQSNLDLSPQQKILQGGRYDGVWRAGFIEGQGRWEYEGTTYTGVWKSGELTGPGTILFASGDRFDGNILKVYFLP